MPRNKVKVNTLSIELQIEIQSMFEGSLMQFHAMSGCTMNRDVFYAVIRGDDALPDDVRAIELAFMNVIQLNAMSDKELILAAQRHMNARLFVKEPHLRRYLQVLVGKLMFDAN